MKLDRFLAVENIILDVESTEGMASLAEVMKKIPQNGCLRNNEKALRDLLEREKLSSTAIGGGFAVPHVFTEEANTPTLVFARSRNGIAFPSLDNKPVHLLLLAFAHPRKKSFFLLCLYHLVRRLKDPQVFKQLMEAEDPRQIVNVFEEESPDIAPELLRPVRSAAPGTPEPVFIPAAANGKRRSAHSENERKPGGVELILAFARSLVARLFNRSVREVSM